MESTDSGLLQTAVTGVPPDTFTHSAPIDLVIGSGRKGQTYLSWRGERLFQLPVSFWTELGTWVGSPGYTEGVMNFERSVTPRCLECHASHVEPKPAPDAANRYEKATVWVGISCERCHGPGAAHVDRQRSAEGGVPARTIVNPAKLSRRRQIEVCAQCHGGIGEPLAPSFSYVPGRPLSEHLRLQEPEPGARIDVHGNQVALLARSPCFQGSSMTCSTCHDPHSMERSPAAFSAKCLSCHQLQQCGRFPEEGASIAGRCTGCHMPELASNAIVSSFEGRSVRPKVRTHWIRVHPQAAAP